MWICSSDQKTSFKSDFCEKAPMYFKHNWRMNWWDTLEQNQAKPKLIWNSFGSLTSYAPAGKQLWTAIGPNWLLCIKYIDKCK